MAWSTLSRLKVRTSSKSGSRPTPASKADWFVWVRCLVTKTLYCPDCTEAEARAQPWDHETEVYDDDQESWEVFSVKRDKAPDPECHNYEPAPRTRR